MGAVVIWLAKLKGWLIGIAAVLAAVTGAWLLGRREGRVVTSAGADAEQQAQTATNNAAAAQAKADNAKVRHDVETDTAKLPDAPAQRVGDAAAGTAAGRLREEGWTR